MGLSRRNRWRLDPPAIFSTQSSSAAPYAAWRANSIAEWAHALPQSIVSNRDCIVSSLALFCPPRRLRLPQGRFVTALRLLLITLPVALFATVHFQSFEVFPQGFAHQC